MSGTPVSELQRQLNEIDEELAKTSRGGLAGLLRAIVQMVRPPAWPCSAGVRAGDLGPGRSAAAPSNAKSTTQRGSRKLQDRLSASVARSAGLPDGSADALVRSLREWQKTRTEQMGEEDVRLAVWEELQRVLGQQTLEDLEAAAARARREADSRAAAADSGRLTRALAQPLGDAELAALRGRTNAALPC